MLLFKNLSMEDVVQNLYKIAQSHLLSFIITMLRWRNPTTEEDHVGCQGSLSLSWTSCSCILEHPPKRTRPYSQWMVQGHDEPIPDPS